METVLKFDSLVMTRVFEPIAWRIESLTGVTNFTLSRLVLLVNPVLWVCLGNRRTENELHFWWVMLALIMTAISVYFFLSCAIEKLSRRSHANPGQLASIFVGWRAAIGLCIAGACAVMPIFLAGSIGFWLCAYFLGCNPIPPGFGEEQKNESATLQTQSI